MIKKSIVIIQFVIVLLLGALIVGQFGMSPEKARRIDRKEPLWFMAPWRPDMKEAAPGPAGPAANQPSHDTTARDMANRRYILTPGPALNAVVTELEARDLEPTGPILIPTEQPQAQPEIHKKGKKAPEPRKTAHQAPPAGPIAVTSLAVGPSGNTVVLKGTASAPVARMELLTFASPPRLILELHGQFAPFDQSVTVPPNPLVQSVSTEVGKDRMRITASLRTNKVSITPALRSGHGSEFTVELLPYASGKPQPDDKR